MEATMAPLGEVAAPDPWPTNYWVRIWTPPEGNNEGWFVDEWRVTDAADVNEVIAWAVGATSPGGTCEVFVQYTNHGVNRNGDHVEASQHIRVYGAPGETNAVTDTIIFTRDGE